MSSEKRSHVIEMSVCFAAGSALAIMVPRLWQRLRRRKCIGYTCDTLPAHPQKILENWWIEKQARGEKSSRALVLATCDQDGGATARYILPHCIDSKGCFVFGTNANSQKIVQLKKNARCEMVWSDLQQNRQVRIRGKAFIPGNQAPASRAVFDMLPESCRLGLTFLEQGKPYSDSEHNQALARFETESSFEKTPQYPSNYTAIIVQPESYEFYIGGHLGYVNDRFLYVLDDNDSSSNDGKDIIITDKPLTFKAPIRLQG